MAMEADRWMENGLCCREWATAGSRNKNGAGQTGGDEGTQ